MSFKSRIRVYRFIMQPLQPYLYGFIIRLLNAVTDENVYKYQSDTNEISVDSGVEERAAGQLEMAVVSLTRFLLLVVVLDVWTGFLLSNDGSMLRLTLAVVTVGLSIILLASSHGLDTPTVQTMVNQHEH